MTLSDWQGFYFEYILREVAQKLPGASYDPDMGLLTPDMGWVGLTMERTALVIIYSEEPVGKLLVQNVLSHPAHKIIDWVLRTLNNELDPGPRVLRAPDEEEEEYFIPKFAGSLEITLPDRRVSYNQATKTFSLEASDFPHAALGGVTLKNPKRGTQLDFPKLLAVRDIEGDLTSWTGQDFRHGFRIVLFND